MKISFRIFLGFAIILAAGFYFFISWMIRDVNTQPKKSMEESLVDIAHILAAFLEENIQDQKISIDSLKTFMARAGRHRFSAKIFEMVKHQVNLDVYVTDQQGTVIFNSNNSKWIGEDFSRKNDVFLTMNGKYGARTSRLDKKDPLSSVAYVAAPIKHDRKIIGVCTVSKAWKSINTFIETTQHKILVAGILGFLGALVLSFFISRWITLPIRRLRTYADCIKEGDRPAIPALGKGEIKELGNSFEKMRESLEGKKYIEKYVQTLTHQLKGPLSAIRGAAELLQEELPEQDQKKFIANIDIESSRLQRIVERMLELASLEHRRELHNVEAIDLSQMVKEIVEDMSPILKQREIIILLKVGENFRLKGERFLVHQAVLNLLQNAVEFTPPGGTISVEIKPHWNRLFLIIRDSGPGIPDYALDKVFDKFYSLQRPDTGKKSSGLGLSLVNEVAELHSGSLTLKNSSTPKNGAIAILKLPMSPPQKT